MQIAAPSTGSLMTTRMLELKPGFDPFATVSLHPAKPLPTKWFEISGGQWRYSIPNAGYYVVSPKTKGWEWEYRSWSNQRVLGGQCLTPTACKVACELHRAGRTQ